MTIRGYDDYEVLWCGSTPDPLGYGKGILLPPRLSVPYEARVWPEALDVGVGDQMDWKAFSRAVGRYRPTSGAWAQAKRRGRPPRYSPEEAKERQLASSRAWKRARRARQKAEKAAAKEAV